MQVDDANARCDAVGADGRLTRRQHQVLDKQRGFARHCYIAPHQQETHMPKGEQRSNKMAKKPKNSAAGNTSAGTEPDGAARDGLYAATLGARTNRALGDRTCTGVGDGRIDLGAGQTAQANIYAVGDIIGFPQLASVSMEQGRLAVGQRVGIAVHREQLLARVVAHRRLYRAGRAVPGCPSGRARQLLRYDVFIQWPVWRLCQSDQRVCCAA